MIRRMLLIVCAVLLLFGLLGTVQGAAQSEDARIRDQIVSIHRRTLAATEKESMHGFCGLQVSWELYLLGINSSLLVCDGNKHFDTYSVMDRTSGGYRPTAYPADKYDMEEALKEISENGTKDVYNIVVGFQTTHTEAGQIYGHASMIHAILDGKVYFVEGFATNFGTQEGQPIVTSISEFVKYWEDWTEYEGLVYFGQKDPLQSYPHVNTQLYIQAEKDVALVDRPLSEEKTVMRTVRAGERIQARAIFNCEDKLYYEIQENGMLGYVDAADMIQLAYGAQNVSLDEPVLPERLETGEDFTIKGKLLSPEEEPAAVQILVKDQAGETVLAFEEEDPGEKFDLNRWSVQKAIDLEKLPQGCYTYEINAQFNRARIARGRILEEKYTYCLADDSFTVGTAEEAAEEKTVPKQGWVLNQGKWQCYKDGQPCTGWYREYGIDYYFLSDGTAVTGWQEVDGQERYFSQTGAMGTGWTVTEAGTMYFKKDGTKTVGRCEIEDAVCFFDDTGIQKKEGWILDDENLYFLQDGKMTVGWTELPEGRFSFHTDGHLIARLIEGKTVPYHGEWIPKEFGNKA